MVEKGACSNEKVQTKKNDLPNFGKAFSVCVFYKCGDGPARGQSTARRPRGQNGEQPHPHQRGAGQQAAFAVHRHKGRLAFGGEFRPGRAVVHVVRAGVGSKIGVIGFFHG